MKIYRTIDDVFKDRRGGANLSEVFEKILKSPYVMEQIEETPFEILEGMQSGDYLDATTQTWVDLSAGLQIKYSKAYQQWYSKNSGRYSGSSLCNIASPEKSPFYMDMRLIPPMRFLFGDSLRTEVLIDQPYWMGTHEVVVNEWDYVMSNNSPATEFKGFPIHPVSYSDALEFCLRATVKLPSAEEWEMACRAGTTGMYSFGDDSGALGVYAWYEGNSTNYIHPVERKLPNAWGLYDMYGNLEEWCTAGDKKSRGVRGGSNSSPAISCSSGYMRFESLSRRRNYNIGFRVMREA